MVIVLANSLPLFDEDGNARSFTMDLISYDAGTEDNNELATHVPGPPFGGMERAPTEGSVIAPHPGIAGTADVGAAFGWTEPFQSVHRVRLPAHNSPYWRKLATMRRSLNWLAVQTQLAVSSHFLLPLVG
jgi:hypothetical protein